MTKNKTLVGRWTSCTVQALTLDTRPIEVGGDEVVIGRDTIAVYNFKNARKKDSPIIKKDYIVFAVYDKFYNKWHMSKYHFAV